MASRPVTLGIDLGTTSVKAALLEAAPGHPSGFVVLASCARAARAETESAAAGPQVRQSPGAAVPGRPWATLFREEVPLTAQSVGPPRPAAFSSRSSKPAAVQAKPLDFAQGAFPPVDTDLPALRLFWGP